MRFTTASLVRVDFNSFGRDGSGAIRREALRLGPVAGDRLLLQDFEGDTAFASIVHVGSTVVSVRAEWATWASTQRVISMPVAIGGIHGIPSGTAPTQPLSIPTATTESRLSGSGATA